jgi:choline dehydrogenase-like flavoprotein
MMSTPGSQRPFVDNAGFNTPGWLETMTIDASGFVVTPILLHPRSRGAITLRDADPLSPPKIHANYFTDTPNAVRGIAAASGSDVDVLARACFLAAQIIGANAVGARLGLDPNVSSTSLFIPLYKYLYLLREN